MNAQLLDVNAAIAGIERTLRRLVGETIELVMKLEPGAAPVMADVDAIEQMVLNLALDACDGMTRGGVLVVETANVRLDDADGAPAPGHAGSHVMIAVTDTGTGFGRAMIFGIVKRIGGQCRVRRQAGRGTQFCVYLPAQTGSPWRIGRPATSTLPAALERRASVA